MAFATLSPENMILTGLKDLDCPGSLFVNICRASGVQVSQGGFSQTMNGKSPAFDRELAQKMLDVLKQLKSLQKSVGVVPLKTPEGTFEVPVSLDWTKIEEISRALTFLRMRNIANKLGDGELAEVADRAAKSATDSVKCK